MVEDKQKLSLKCKLECKLELKRLGVLPCGFALCFMLCLLCYVIRGNRYIYYDYK